MPSDQRREAKKQRDSEKHAREAKRLADRTAAEARRHGGEYWGGGQ
jgi:hypothetical protein